MADFKENIERGLRAHQVTLRHRAEISEVLNELNEQMLASTNGKVGAKVKDLRLSIVESVELGNEMSSAIVAVSTAYPDIFKRIAFIVIPPSAYPVTLVYNRDRIACKDRPSFEATLGSILAQPPTGKAILDIMEYVPQNVSRLAEPPSTTNAEEPS
ncbi:MAG: hypothetical protein EOP22_14590 [Hyphomicrobiales bacterium]|nr:MAG: hypothetical protein EOP22_14590 [Hyphomicrobiales bacterium]